MTSALLTSFNQISVSDSPMRNLQDQESIRFNLELSEAESGSRSSRIVDSVSEVESDVAILKAMIYCVSPELIGSWILAREWTKQEREKTRQEELMLQIRCANDVQCYG